MQIYSTMPIKVLHPQLFSSSRDISPNMEEATFEDFPEGRSVDSEILFEKIKALPKRSAYYGIHRKLSWQCSREIRQYERDYGLFSKEFLRSEARMKERMEILKKRKRELMESGAHSSVLLRRRVRQPNPKTDTSWRFETNLDNSCKIIEILVTEEENVEQPVKPKLRREQTICADSSTLLPGTTTIAEKIRSLSSTRSAVKNKRQQRVSSFSGHLKTTR